MRARRNPLTFSQIVWLQNHTDHLVMGLSKAGDHWDIQVLHQDGTVTPMNRCRTPIDEEDRLVGIPS